MTASSILLVLLLSSAAALLAASITVEVRERMSERLRIKRELLKAQRQIHSLAVAAFAEMLDDARIGRLDDNHVPGSAAPD